ncbi:methyltransferase domain protein [Sphingobacterium spiritivorum ATCC 33300]|uniref:Methyltransferase domain protein n=1 Tax=Sphingobacterium spiritivorum ATCC 33300 TaxID=525372 RepID=C2FUK3_SPHSI|nr:class I SAM-dependent methyltransferase [Sphingobacterium spiritivorum]EEI93400.1 methyltransferase domain protein [Sphingobacterium spiritivorum ATCC 33300]QQS95915.1 class I SAM-dependent methyltransferase [Sphingobacterium spiritivorum]
MEHKSTLREIEERFDQDVARFSNLDTGQQTTLDALYNMELITDGIAASYAQLGDVLDVGCGAGNYPVKLLSKVRNPNITLVDLSKPMLDKAVERIKPLTSGRVDAIKADFQTLEFPAGSFDVIVATAVLHHLRTDADWESAFAKFYEWLRPGGSIWIFDLLIQQEAGIQQLIYKERYGAYLKELKDEAYRDHVFAYIEKEDTPQTLVYQLDLLRQAGFRSVDVLHKNLCFASFVAFR